MLIPDSQFTGNEQSYSLDRYIQKLSSFSTWTKNQGLQKLSISLKVRFLIFFPQRYEDIFWKLLKTLWKNTANRLRNPGGKNNHPKKYFVSRRLCKWVVPCELGKFKICDGNWGVNLNSLVSRFLDWRGKRSCQQQTAHRPAHRPYPCPKISLGMNEKQLYECQRGFLSFILMDSSLDWKHFHFL